MNETFHLAGEGSTHRRIIEAALQEFTERGYKGASTRAIAERAGVNEVTLFRHFGSKLDLLRIAVEYEVSQMHVPESLEPYLEMDFRAGFTAFLREFLMQLTCQSDILMLGFAESYSHPQIVYSLRQMFWRIRITLQDFFNEMQKRGRMREADNHVLSQMVIATLHTTPLIKKHAPSEWADQLTDERLIAALVETIASAYGISNSTP